MTVNVPLAFSSTVLPSSKVTLVLSDKIVKVPSSLIATVLPSSKLTISAKANLTKLNIKRINKKKNSHIILTLN